MGYEILRCAQDDSQDTFHVRSREPYLQMSKMQEYQLYIVAYIM
jgi:hypothetical protein